MRARFSWLGIWLVLLIAPAALGAAADSPLVLYQAGAYEEAVAAGEAEGTGTGLATAARAALADANLRDVPCLACLKRAENLARRSLAFDRTRPEAFVYLAASLGYQARIVGIFRARFARYPEQAREAIDAALALDPGDPWVLASAGAWQVEVVRNGGAFLARTLYGARFETGTEYFRRAIAAEPENLVIRVQYALSLSGYDFENYREEALAELSTAVKTAPRTAYEAALQKRAEGLLKLVSANKLADYRARVRLFQGYP
jgi:tetratricopeptide (TPR) repeat protein